MNIISNRALFLALTGELDVEAHTIKVALMTSSYTVNKDTNTFVNTNEVSGTGYTAGGVVLGGSTVTQDDVNDEAAWDANDAEWIASTITARYAVLYNVTKANQIICVFDFGTDQVSSNGIFAVRWHADGILGSAQA